MTSPISIGDAYLMGRLALRLGRAFTAGRKSAPAEFREVENQLYSLSAALCALKDASTGDSAGVSIEASRLPRVSQQRHADGNDIIRSMLRNCEETLKHLGDIVEKYSCIGNPRSSEPPLLKRWSRDLRHNWKKIAWTTEGGDLAILRSQLTVHVNSLNLVLGVVVNSQANRLEDRVEQVAAMLEEIHVWFVENLKDAPSTTESLGTGNGNQDQCSSLDGAQFRLYTESEQGLNIICSHASLHPKWNHKHSRVGESASTVHRQLFICHCSRVDGVAQPHSSRIAAYGLSPLSFPVQLTDKERSWMLYKATDQTTNRLVSLIIKCVTPSGMAEFEEIFIHRLSVIRAQTMLRRNMGTMLAYFNPGGQQAHPEARILNLMGDMNMVQKFADTVTFSADRHSYTRSSIESIQILHYKSLDSGYVLADPALPKHALSCLDSSEIVIYYAQQDPQTAAEDIDRTILHLKHETKVTYTPDDSAVLLQGIDCLGLRAEQQKSLISGIDVKFRFTTPKVAEKFQRKVEEMRTALFIMSLQFPQVDERPILRLQAWHVHTEDIHISNAEVSIVQNTKTQRRRLIIVSQNGCSILSQELPENFLTQTSSGFDPNFTSPTYLIQTGESGARQAFRYARGFKYLVFGDVRIRQLFKLGLAAIASSPNLPTTDILDE